jgi:hypothetical protein
MAPLGRCVQRKLPGRHLPVRSRARTAGPPPSPRLGRHFETVLLVEALRHKTHLFRLQPGGREANGFRSRAALAARRAGPAEAAPNAGSLARCANDAASTLSRPHRTDLEVRSADQGASAPHLAVATGAWAPHRRHHGRRRPRRWPRCRWRGGPATGGPGRSAWSFVDRRGRRPPARPAAARRRRGRR